MPLVAMDLRSTHDTGVARYGRSLLAAVAAPARAAGFRLLVVVRDGAQAATHDLLVGQECADTHEIVGIPGDTGFLRDSAVLRSLLTRRRVDLYHSTHYVVDLACPIPYVLTVHDLLRWRFPRLTASDEDFVKTYGKQCLHDVWSEVLDPDRGPSTQSAMAAPAELDPSCGVFARGFAVLTRRLVRSASHVVTVSEATAREMAELVPPPGGSIVVPGAVDTDVFRPRGRREIDAARTAHRLVGPYVLYVGLAHRGKRLPWLIRELVGARPALPPDTRFVVVGGHAERDEETRRAVETLDAADFVRFAGRVDDDDLAALYTGATACLSASVGEGSHLPSQEALACGCEVVAPDLPALRETTAGHAHLYSPGRAGMPGSLVTGLLDATVPARARGYAPGSWHDSAVRLIACWESILGGRNGVLPPSPFS